MPYKLATIKNKFAAISPKVGREYLLRLASNCQSSLQANKIYIHPSTPSNKYFTK